RRLAHRGPDGQRALHARSSIDSPLHLAARHCLRSRADCRLIRARFLRSFHLVFRTILWWEGCPLAPNVIRRVTGASDQVRAAEFEPDPQGSRGGSMGELSPRSLLDVLGPVRAGETVQSGM